MSTAKTDASKARAACVVIVGGGFGGLAAAKALRKAPVEVILIDRTNHHVFQPLLYQVATSVLAPSQISSPIRGILRKQKNTTVIMGEVTGVDKERRCVFVNSADREHVPVHYDYLVLATGVRHSYFGHDEFEKFAPGLKNLADAVAIRNKVLQAFEQAEAEEDPQLHQDLLTFVLVGGGPTGVEMAAAFAIFVRTTLSSDFRRIDPTKARIVLVDAGPGSSAPSRRICQLRRRSAWRSSASKFAWATPSRKSTRKALSLPVNASRVRPSSGLPESLLPPRESGWMLRRTRLGESAFKEICEFLGILTFLSSAIRPH